MPPQPTHFQGLRVIAAAPELAAAAVVVAGEEAAVVDQNRRTDRKPGRTAGPMPAAQSPGQKSEAGRSTMPGEGPVAALQAARRARSQVPPPVDCRHQSAPPSNTDSLQFSRKSSPLEDTVRAPQGKVATTRINSQQANFFEYYMKFLTVLPITCN